MFQSAPTKRTTQLLLHTEENGVYLQSFGTGPLSISAKAGGGWAWRKLGVYVTARSYFYWVKVNQSHHRPGLTTRVP